VNFGVSVPLTFKLYWITTGYLINALLCRTASEWTIGSILGSLNTIRDPLLFGVHLRYR